MVLFLFLVVFDSLVDFVHIPQRFGLVTKMISLVFLVLVE